MNNPEEKLKVAIAQMARSSMPSWQQFVSEYRAYCDGIVNQLITSPSSTLEQAQGRAIQAREFLRILDSAIKDADLIQNRNKT